MIPGLDAAINTAMGLLLEKHNDRRQLRQQGKLMALETQGSKEMARYNQDLAYEMWEKTNYSNQMEQMKKAGLNPSLMYAKGGGTGISTDIPGGKVSGGTAQGQAGEIGMALQLGMQKKMQEAQIKVAESQANLNNTQASKLGGVDTTKTEAETVKVGQEIEAIKQQIKNAKAQETLTKYQADLTRIEGNIKEQTQQDVIQQIRNSNEIAEQEIIRLGNNNEITNETKEEVINQINRNSVEQGLRITASKAGINLTNEQVKKVGAEIGKMGNDVLSKWRELDQQKQQIEINKILMQLKQQSVEFETSTPEQIRQWTSILTDLIPLAGKKK